MKKVLFCCGSLIVLALIILQIVAIVQNRSLKNDVMKFREEIKEEFSLMNEKLIETEERMNEQFVLNFLRLDEIKELQNKNNTLSNAQYRQTVSMKKTYDNILEEQKKKTIDVSKKDATLEEKRERSKKYFSQKEFSLCYRIANEILSFENDDVETRLLKAKSLYYMNPLDSTKYEEILSDIKIVKARGLNGATVEEIESIIKEELGLE